MSRWQYWWRRWLAAHTQAQHPQHHKELDHERADDLSPDLAAALISQPAARHPVNTPRLVTATRRLQRQLGNRAVQLLAQQPGEPLPSGLRAEMSSELGDDLADVRLHTGPAGADIARAAGAEAVTVGHDIAFDSGAYAPDTPPGRQRLAHELAHAVQAGEGSGWTSAALEAEAQHGGRPTRGAAAPGQVLRQETQPWHERVQAATAITDPRAQRTALIALAQEALAGYTVHIVAGGPSSGPVHPSQYQPAPAINFDFYLEQKSYWPGGGRQGVLGPRTGYFFSANGQGYAIIGPRAIEAHTPTLTRMYADHELFHAQRHVGSQGSRSDEELAAWIDAFTHYFHQVYGARKSWQPLIDYYESASPGAQRQALSALVDYFHQQSPEVQRAILAWLQRRQRDMRDKLLVQHLAARLGAGRLGPSPAPPAAPP